MIEQMVLNQKERLISILKRVPTERRTFIAPGGAISMAVLEVMEKTDCYLPEAHSDAEKMAKLAISTNRLTSAENVGVPFCTTVEAEAMGSTVELGTKEKRPKITAYALEGMADIDRLSPIDPDKGRARVCVEAVKLIRKKVLDVAIVANLAGPVSLAASLIDPGLFTEAIRNDKDKAQELIKLTTKNLIKFGDAMLEAGADVICIAEAASALEVIDQSAFKAFVLPYVNEMADHFQDAFGAQSIVYFCGDAMRFGDTLSDVSAAAIGIDSVADVKTVKSLARCKAIMGNVDVELLEHGEANAVFRAGMQSLIDGVDIVSPACGIGLKTPIANARSLIRAVMRSDPPAPCC